MTDFAPGLVATSPTRPDGEPPPKPDVVYCAVVVDGVARRVPLCFPCKRERGLPFWDCDDPYVDDKDCVACSKK